MIRKTYLLALFLFISLAAVKAQTTTADTTVYTNVDKAPEFIGGDKKYIKFLVNTVRYPAHARETNTQGKVELEFIVEKDGMLTDLHVVKSAGSDLDAEALRVMRLSPKWLPGIKDGKAVRSLSQKSMGFSLSQY